MAKIRDGASYLGGHLTSNDYYNKDETVTGSWVGNLANEWGLEGKAIGAGDVAFENLRLGKTPDGKESLTQRGGGSVRFFDFQCSAQKSVSLMAVTLGDERLREAHERIARQAFEEALQHFAARRVRNGNKAWSEDTEITGKVIAASFVHDASRATPSPDPQIHTHFVIGNATVGKDGRRYALDTKQMCQAIRYAGKTYQAGMAKACRELGYQIEEKRDSKGRVTGFEIAGISEQILKRFSKRRGDVQSAIGRFIMENGREPSPAEIHVLTLESRGKDRHKLQEISTAEVRALQLAQLSIQERAGLEALRDSAISTPSPASSSVSQEECDEAVLWAVEHLTERESVTSKFQIIAEGLNAGMGKVDRSGISEAVERQIATGNLVTLTEAGLQSQLTTPEILEMEREAIAAVERGRGGLAPVATFIESPGLSAEQNEAVRLLTRTKSRHAILRGVAGSGKTTTLKAFNECLASSGQKPLYLAPTASAVKVIKQELGCEAMTVSAYLEALKGVGRKKFKGRVIAVDEAGLLSLSQGREILKAESLGQRVFFIGDSSQMHSVEKGDFLTLLENHTKIQRAEIKDIKRQKVAEYRAAVMTMSAGSGGAKAGLEQLQKMGWVESAGASYLSRASELWLEQTENGKSPDACILVCPTHAEGRAVTEKIRSSLRSTGQLGEGVTTTVSDSLSWTLAQRRKIENFTPGMLVTATRDCTALSSGETASVVSLKEGKVLLSNGKSIEPKRAASLFDVGTPRQLDIAKGDRIQIRQNLKSASLVNGEVLEVAEISPQGIQTRCGKLIPKGFTKLDFGYTSTVFSSQGRTSNKVIISAERLDAKSCYVAVSRGRERCTILTPDAEALMGRLPDGNRQSVSDVVAGRNGAINRLSVRVANRRTALHLWVCRIMSVASRSTSQVMKAGRRLLIHSAIGRNIVYSRRSGVLKLKSISLPLPLPKMGGVVYARTGRGGR